MNITDITSYARVCSLYSDILQCHRILSTKLILISKTCLEDINTLLKSIQLVSHRR
jgi:hypothetical protein